MTTALYLRVSTDDQADRQLPIDGQRDACLAHAAAMGWPVSAEFADPGISGTSRNRPGLLALLAAARAGEVTRVLAWDSSRIARDLALYGWVLTELRDAGAVLALVQGANASPLESDMRAVLSAEQVRQIRAATRRGLLAAAARGHRHGTGRMLGYRWEDRDHRVVVDDEAAVVRDVYQRAAAGEPLADLGRSLGWARDRLLRVLRHPAYAGAHVTGRRTGSLATGRRRQPREAWRVSWGAHPAIVPRELWEAVQARLDGHRPGPPSREGRLALSGLLVCQDCGDLLRCSGWSMRADGSRVIRYRCPGCDRRVSTRGWAGLVLAEIVQGLASKETARDLAALLRAAHDTGEAAGRAAAEVARLTRARDALLAVIESGELSDPRAAARRLEAVQQALRVAEGAAARARVQSAGIPGEAEIRARLLALADRLGRLDGDLDYVARGPLRMVAEAVEIDLETSAGEIILAETAPGSRSWTQAGFGRIRLPWAA